MFICNIVQFGFSLFFFFLSYSLSYGGFNQYKNSYRLTSIILPTKEAEIRKIMVQSQSRQVVHKTLSQKSLYKIRAGGVAQGEGPEFKPQNCKKKKQKKFYIHSV
jgi:hypothetical protein